MALFTRRPLLPPPPPFLGDLAVLPADQLPGVADALRQFIGHLGEKAGTTSVDVEYFGTPAVGVRVEVRQLEYGAAAKVFSWRPDREKYGRPVFGLGDLLSLWDDVLGRYQRRILRSLADGREVDEDVAEFLSLAEAR